MKNRATAEFKIQLDDERKGIRDVWCILGASQIPKNY